MVVLLSSRSAPKPTCQIYNDSPKSAIPNKHLSQACQEQSLLQDEATYVSVRFGVGAVFGTGGLQYPFRLKSGDSSSQARQGIGRKARLSTFK